MYSEEVRGGIEAVPSLKEISLIKEKEESEGFDQFAGFLEPFRLLRRSG